MNKSLFFVKIKNIFFLKKPKKIDCKGLTQKYLIKNLFIQMFKVIELQKLHF